MGSIEVSLSNTLNFPWNWLMHRKQWLYFSHGLKSVDLDVKPLHNKTNKLVCSHKKKAKSTICKEWQAVLLFIQEKQISGKLLSAQYLPETAVFKSHFSERPQDKYYHVTILHSKSLKKCHKKFENWLTNILC